MKTCDFALNLYNKILKLSPVDIAGLALLKKNLLQCNMCDRLVEARKEILGENHYPILFKSSPVAKIMLTGIAPGRLKFDRSQLMEKEHAFGMGSGKVLNRLFDDLGLMNEIFHITNIIKCTTPQNGTFTQEEVKCCVSLFLQKEIELVNPILTLVLGRQAERCFQEYMLLNNIFYAYKYLPHPAAVSRGFMSYNEYKKEFLLLLTEIEK